MSKMKFLQSDKWNKDTLYKAYKLTELNTREPELYKIAEFKILHSKSGQTYGYQIVHDTRFS